MLSHEGRADRKVGCGINVVKNGHDNDLRTFLASTRHEIYGVKEAIHRVKGSVVGQGKGSGSRKWNGQKDLSKSEESWKLRG